MPSLNPSTAPKIQALLDAAVAAGAIPGAIVRAVDARNTALLSVASGTVTAAPTDGDAAPKPHALADTDVVHLWSFCKLVVSVAIMQLVERGRIPGLDAADVVAETLPELLEKRVLAGFDAATGAPVVERRRSDAGFTVRQLVTHSNGTGISIFDEGMLRQYGVGQDWATVLVERLSGQNMQDYCTEHIFKPLGMNSSCFDAHMPPASSPNVFPSYTKLDPANPGRLTPDASLSHSGPPPSHPGPFFPASGHHRYIGGSGLASTAPDFCALLATLLAGGASPATGHRLLSPESAALFFENQLPAGVAFDGRVPAVTPMTRDAVLEGAVGVTVAGAAVAGEKGPVVGGGRKGRRGGSTWWADLLLVACCIRRCSFS
ncbi:beta-lactamase [Neofusicoccum parvum]|nr:beta-lactamase [Neofusicoccum parvum]